MPEPTLPSRTLVIDPGMQGAVGHHANLNRSFDRGFRARGIEPIFLVHRGCNDAIVAGLKVGRLFQQSPYAPLSTDPYVRDLEQFFAFAEKFEEDLHQIPPELLGRDALIVLPTMTPGLYYGYARWWSGLDPALRPKTAMQFHMHSGLLSRDPFRPDLRNPSKAFDAYLFRFAGNQIKTIGAEEFALFAPTTELQADFELLLSRPVALNPVYISADLARFDAMAAAHEASERPPVVGYLGDGRQNKGYLLVPALAQALMAAHPTVEMIIQLNGLRTEPKMTAATERILDLARTEPRIRPIRGFAEHDDYFKQMVGVDAVLQPYRLRDYDRCLSGVFIEAAFLGRACIVPKGTAMADGIAAMGGFGRVYEGGEQALLSATLALIADVPALRAAAAPARTAWRARHGTGKMIDQILAFAKGQQRVSDARY